MEKNITARYSDIELQEFKDLIEKKLELALEEYNFLNNQIAELNGRNSDRDSGDFMDDSNKQTEVELLSSMMLRQRQFIRSLDNALIRIKNKTYGICAVTGELISKERLKLVPHATKSIAGKNSEQTNNRISTERKPLLKKTATPKSFSRVIPKQSSDKKKNEPGLFNWENEGDEEDSLENFNVDISEIYLEDRDQHFKD